MGGDAASPQQPDVTTRTFPEWEGEGLHMHRGRLCDHRDSVATAKAADI
jgi:hypothetical protein